MRTRNLLAFASTITGIILLASCSEQKAWQDGTISPLGGKYPLRLSANVEQVQSRSTGKDAWTGGEEIGVILESQTGKYYITDASGNVEAIDESNTLYWPHTAKAEVKAWYPFDTPTLLDISDQSAGYAAFDILSAQTRGSFNQPVYLNFGHSMSKIAYTLAAADGITEIELNSATVTLLGDAEARIEAGIVAPADQTDGEIKPFHDATAKQGEALVVPQNMKGKPLFKVSIGNNTFVYTPETDEEGNFLIDGLAFHDSTSFLVQALNAKGRRGVTVRVDQDEFLPPHYTLPNTLEAKKKEDDFYKKFGQDYYYENGEKVYVLDEVLVSRKKQKKSYSFYDHLAHYQLDSTRIAEYSMMPIELIIQQLPGVTFEKDDEGNDCFKHFGRTLYVLVNDFEETIDQVRLIPAGALRNISMLDQMQGRTFFGDRGANGVLIISAEPGWTPKDLGRPNILPFKIMGYQIPDAFYVPKYEIDSVRRDNRYDERSTIYWKPVVKISKDAPAKLSFYTADTYGKYSVIVEGITSRGVICRKRVPLILK